MEKSNCNLDGTEARFLLQLLTGGHVAVTGPTIAYAAKLAEKLNNLHMNQPVDHENQEAMTKEVRLLSGIQGAEQ